MEKAALLVHVVDSDDGKDSAFEDHK